MTNGGEKDEDSRGRRGPASEGQEDGDVGTSSNFRHVISISFLPFKKHHLTDAVEVTIKREAEHEVAVEGLRKKIGGGMQGRPGGCGKGKGQTDVIEPDKNI